MSAQAKLVAEIEGRTLLLHNRGSEEAHDIRLQVEGQDAADSPLVFDAPSKCSRLAPEDPPYEFELRPLNLDPSNPRRIEIRIAWETESGERGEWKRELRRPLDLSNLKPRTVGRPKPPFGEWYYRRIERISRAYGRYLLLLLLVIVYSIGTQLSPESNVQVPILGLGPMPKPFVHLALVSLGCLLLIGILGSLQALGRAYDKLRKHYHRSNVSGAGLDFNYLDAVISAGYVWDRPLLRHDRWGYLLIAAVPLLALGWLVVLFWESAVCLGRKCELQEGLLLPAILSATLLILVALRLKPFLKGQVDMWRLGYVTDQESK